MEGWWKGRHRNAEVNNVFRRINNFTYSLPRRFEIHTTYIPSGSNPADPPSRGILGPPQFLLPSIDLPEPVRNFLVDATETPTPTELRLLREGHYPPAAQKNINRAILQQEANKRSHAFRKEEDRVVLDALQDI